MNDISLQLKSMTEADLQTVAELLLNDQVKKTYMVPDMTQSEACELAHRIIGLSHQTDRYVRGMFCGEVLVGILNDTDIDEGSVELGWAVLPQYWGKGYATEAVKAAIAELFEMGFCQVLAGAFEDNAASIRVMQKACMLPMDKTEQIEYRSTIHRCVFYCSQNPKRQ